MKLLLHVTFCLLTVRFQVCVLACDESGSIDILMENREIQSIIGKTVFDLTEEVHLYI